MPGYLGSYFHFVSLAATRKTNPAARRERMTSTYKSKPMNHQQWIGKVDLSHDLLSSSHPVEFRCLRTVSHGWFWDQVYNVGKAF